jgi:antitoxin CptB
MKKPLISMDSRLKRLRYRSWHRGVKETDLILGKFADERLESLSPALLDDFERLLEENDADIWDWIVGKCAPKADYATLIEMMKKAD